MKRHYGVKVMKNCFLIFILALVVIGITTVTTGAVMMGNTKHYNHFLDSTLHTLSIVMMATGLIVLLIAGLGQYGSIKESSAVLIIFAVLLIAITIMEIAVATVAGLRQREQVLNLDDSVRDYRTFRKHKDTWDFVHQEFRCCGTDGLQSWKAQTVPLSCCHSIEQSKDGNSPSGYCDYQGKGKYLFVNGCLIRLRQKVKIYARILMGICIGAAFAKVSGICLAFVLACCFKQK